MTDLRRTALVAGAGAGVAGDGLFLTALAWSVLQATGSPQPGRDAAGLAGLGSWYAVRGSRRVARVGPGP